jgi:hypothetical protein
MVVSPMKKCWLPVQVMLFICGNNQSNTLTVIARDSDIFLYINNQFVTRVSDSSASSGFIGMIGINNTGQGALDMAFTNAQVWQI